MSTSTTSRAARLTAALLCFVLPACAAEAPETASEGESAVTVACDVFVDETLPTTDDGAAEPTDDNLLAAGCTANLYQDQAKNCAKKGDTISAKILCGKKCGNGGADATITVTCTACGAFKSPTSAQLKSACGN